MRNITISSLNSYKQTGEKFSCLTAYDASFATLLCEAGVEVILIGDTLGCVFQGHTTTIPVQLNEMIYHTQCVTAGNQNALLIADLPFMTYATPEKTFKSAAKLMQAGAHIVKLEGSLWLADTIQQLSDRGIPVCAHLGITPQSVHKQGGYKVQGKEAHQAEKLLENAIALQKAGAALLVLECIPKTLAEEISKNLTIPTIGIGAGPYCDGQILVLYDMLGLTSGKQPRFVRDFFATTQANSIKAAINEYVKAVKSLEFPAEEHCY